MSNGQLPSNVHVLKPRTLSLSDRLDRFLENNALSPDEAPIRHDPTRPKAPGINAIKCASCEHMEYLSRDHCRCGHYLRGQLEDEFLAWEGQIAEVHERLVETVQLKLRKLRYLNLLGLPFLIIPMLVFATSTEGLTLSLMGWMAVSVAIMGVCACVEKYLLKPVEDSRQFLSSYSLETYLEERFLLQSGLVQ